MNFNALIAILVLKSVITEDEGQRLVEHLHDKPQSTELRDAIAAVAEVIGKPTAPLVPHMGPVGPAQQAEEALARTQPVEQPVLDAADIPTPEPELAANDPVLDADQAEVPTGGENYTPETEKNAKDTSVDKPSESAKKK